MEHFQWLSVEEATEHARHEPARNDIQDELADVFCYVLALANAMDVDLSTAIEAKMVKNRKKYPVDDYRGRF